MTCRRIYQSVWRLLDGVSTCSSSLGVQYCTPSTFGHRQRVMRQKITRQSIQWLDSLGSTDAAHIMLERVQYRVCQTHIGFKMLHTDRTYNITVNHRRQILATTAGHPARWNTNPGSVRQFHDRPEEWSHHE
jgi:hypothetical protein